MRRSGSGTGSSPSASARHPDGWRERLVRGFGPRAGIRLSTYQLPTALAVPRQSNARWSLKPEDDKPAAARCWAGKLERLARRCVYAYASTSVSRLVQICLAQDVAFGRRTACCHGTQNIAGRCRMGMRFERWKSLDAVIRAHLRCSNVAGPWSLPCPRTSTRTFCAWGGACSQGHGGLIIALVRRTEE